MSDELKAIREHIHKYGILSTSFGDVVVDKTLLGQGSNGLVFPVDFEGPTLRHGQLMGTSFIPNRALDRSNPEG